jgi:hypothetical protein
MFSYIVFATTFVLFLLEAILHYNIGRYEENEGIKFYLPDKKEFIALVAVLIVFSIANSLCANYLTKK